jgi:hypothetical protein
MDPTSSSIDLRCGTTLKLECSALATVRLVEGRAWLSAGHVSLHMRPGKPIAVNGQGPTLIHALADASLSVETTQPLRLELRSRGEVTPLTSPKTDDQCIDVTDRADLARWAEELCTTPEALRAAIEAVGPRVGDVKRYLFVGLVRRNSVAQ